MKTHLAFLSILLLSLNAKAFVAQSYDASSYEDAYEDTPEFLQEIPTEEAIIEANEPDLGDGTLDREPYPDLKADALKKIQGKGNWAFKFILVKPDGTSKLLTEYRAESPMKPASTLKLFTGWMGYNKNAKSDAYLTHMLQVSDNAQANQTLQTVGGTKRMVQYYQKMDLPVNASNFKPVDGCGLSHSNRVTVDLEIELLEKIRQSDQYHDFKTMLAQPGEKGTLRHRLSALAARLFGKTGTLRDTAALAGFVELSNGTLIFSVISNQLKVSLPSARATIDSLVQSHANYVENAATH